MNDTQLEPKGVSCQKTEAEKLLKIETGKYFTLEIPEGQITKRGEAEIRRMFCSYYPSLPEEFEFTWLTKRGTFPKRVQSFYHKHGVKLTAEQVSNLGNLARAHSNMEKEIILDFTEKLDWEDGDFGDHGSCFWGSNSEAKGMIEEHGYAVRLWRNNKGYARAWIAPINDNRLIVFNGYGETTLTIARFLALFFGVSYQKIQLLNNGNDSGLLYINSAIGYVIGSHEKVENMEKHDLGWEDPPEERPYCEYCDCHVVELTTALNGNGNRVEICNDCVNYCDRCEENYTNSTTYQTEGPQHGNYLCDSCIEAVAEEIAEAEAEAAKETEVV